MPSYDYGSDLLEMDLPKRNASVEVKLVDVTHGDELFGLLSSPNSTDYEVLAVKRSKESHANTQRQYHRLATKDREVVTKDGSDPNIPRMGVSKIKVLLSNITT
jgi:hypothetical protein